ncbi:MAG TPA: hypothetical protein VFW40_12210 [Capsulimonadaceae bacterium]|nr:hypothetical protein [Capsulimonadaceae bacterium]
MVANVAEIRQSGKRSTRTGRRIRYFPSGARVYCFPPVPGDKYQNVRVIGRLRGSRGYETAVVPSNRLTNWRAQIVYSPAIIEQMAGHWQGDAEPLARQVAAAMQRKDSVI